MEPPAPADDAAPEIVSAFPLPPAFFALYADGVESGPPPPAPMEPQYHMFGTPFSTQDVVPDLLPLPGQKLYVHAAPKPAADVDSGDADTAASATGADAPATGPIDFQRELKTLNHSLLANFMELVDVLMKQPALFNEKLADLELLFLNMHNLINAFRPHQARETIIHMLEMQIQERRDAAHEIRKTIDEARRNVEDVHGELHDHALDAMHSQDAVDIKMEDADDSATASDASGATASVGTATATPQGDASAKNLERQQMQEAFFGALQSIAGVTQ